MNIFDIDEKMLELIDEETGELKDIEAFKELAMERDRKIENAALWAKELKAKSEALRVEAGILDARKKTADRNIERLKGYLDYALNGNRFETPRVVISYRRSKRINVLDEQGLRRWAEDHGCLRFKDPELDKTKITQAIKNGEMVIGAELAECNNIQIG